jgi:hypothetical protein
VRRAGWLELDIGQPLVPCVLWDISVRGARITAPWPDNLPQQFAVLLDNKKVRRFCRVIWRRDRFVGVSFDEELP